jgi:hypothetical protein
MVEVVVAHNRVSGSRETLLGEPVHAEPFVSPKSPSGRPASTQSDVGGGYGALVTGRRGDMAGGVRH